MLCYLINSLSLWIRPNILVGGFWTCQQKKHVCKDVFRVTTSKHVSNIFAVLFHVGVNTFKDEFPSRQIKMKYFNIFPFLLLYDTCRHVYVKVRVRMRTKNYFLKAFIYLSLFANMVKILQAKVGSFLF